VHLVSSKPIHCTFSALWLWLSARPTPLDPLHCVVISTVAEHGLGPRFATRTIVGGHTFTLYCIVFGSPVAASLLETSPLVWAVASAVALPPGTMTLALAQPAGAAPVLRVGTARAPCAVSGELLAHDDHVNYTMLLNNADFAS
jgi:hypothetical protein